MVFGVASSKNREGASQRRIFLMKLQQKTCMWRYSDETATKDVYSDETAAKDVYVGGENECFSGKSK